VSRTAKGTFAPGSSGNPQGRKVGSGRLAGLRASIEASVPAILQALTAQALAGDPQACRLLLERALPALRPEERGVAIPLPADASLADQGRAILHAVAGGELAPSQAATLLSGLGQLAKVVEVDELLRRIESLEARVDGKP
jgi:hypothetical protein